MLLLGCVMTKNQQEAIERACGHENLLQELVGTLQDVFVFLADPAIGTWQYMEGEGFYRDLGEQLERIDKVLARATSQDVK